MKPYHILRAFDGSQSGNDKQSFVAGTVDQLSDSLATIAVKEGWVKAVEPQLLEQVAQAGVAAIQGIVSALGAPPPDTNESESAMELAMPAEPEFIADRETKVIEPEETKPAKPVAKKKGK